MIAITTISFTNVATIMVMEVIVMLVIVMEIIIIMIMQKIRKNQKLFWLQIKQVVLAFQKFTGRMNVMIILL